MKIASAVRVFGLLSAFAALSATAPLSAQNTLDPSTNDPRSNQSASTTPTPSNALGAVGRRILEATTDEERLAAHTLFLDRLRDTLKKPQSLDWDYSSITSASKLLDPKTKFMIWTWQIPRRNGRFEHSGLIVYRGGDQGNVVLELRPGSDSLGVLVQGERGPENWPGCLYYAIRPLDRDHYLLLGYDQHDLNERRKVIEILRPGSFNRPRTRFGARVFETPVWLDQRLKQRPHRLVLRYSAQSTALLRWEPEQKRLVMDHLIPPDAALKGQYHLYAPDLTYDALEWKKGQFKLVEQIAPPSTLEAPFRAPDRGQGLAPGR